jgi:hypothetical protein
VWITDRCCSGYSQTETLGIPDGGPRRSCQSRVQQKSAQTGECFFVSVSGDKGVCVAVMVAG